jgi:hypothetical protein
MPKFSRLRPARHQSHHADIKTIALISGLACLTLADCAAAADWAELTGVAPIEPAPAQTQKTKLPKAQIESDDAANTRSPYTIMSQPQSTGKTSSTKDGPAFRQNKTREYDLEVSAFEPQKNNSEPKKSILSRVVSAPKKAIGVTCGVCVGVPVSIARDTKTYTSKMMGSMNDGLAVEKKGDIVGHVMSGACAVPFGLGSGLVHGGVTGVQRAVEHGKTQPFSKESMSLGAKAKSVSNRSDISGDN